MRRTSLAWRPSALSDALKSAEKKQVDAAFAAGETEGAGRRREGRDRLRARRRSSTSAPAASTVMASASRRALVRRAAPAARYGGMAGGLDAAATYLGVTEGAAPDRPPGRQDARGRREGDPGQERRRARLGDGRRTKTKLDAAVKAGTLTQSQADTIASDLKARTTDLVNGKRPARPDFDQDGPGGGYGFRHFQPNRLGPAQSGGRRHVRRLVEMSVAASAGDRARLNPVRRRAATAKRALAAATLLGFAVTFGLARESHPGQASSSSGGAGSGSTASTSSDESGDDFGFGFDSGSIGAVVGRRRRPPPTSRTTRWCSAPRWPGTRRGPAGWSRRRC